MLINEQFFFNPWLAGIREHTHILFLTIYVESHDKM